MTTYRKIWTDAHGPIPTDDSGRSYEIHHLDKNHSNDALENLQLVTIQEHYDIHFSQGDWGACQRIAQRMDTSPEVKSKLASNLQNERVRNGTHQWLGGEMQREVCRRQVENGTHAWQRSKHQKDLALARREEGTLPGQIASRNGTHNFIGGEVQRQSNQRRIANGTHHLLGASHNLSRIAAGTHPSQTKLQCPHCNLECAVNNYSKYHGEKCKLKP